MILVYCIWACKNKLRYSQYFPNKNCHVHQARQMSPLGANFLFKRSYKMEKINYLIDHFTKTRFLPHMNRNQYTYWYQSNICIFERICTYMICPCIYIFDNFLVQHPVSMAVYDTCGYKRDSPLQSNHDCYQIKSTMFQL